MPSVNKVLVVGGGIGGLTIASSLCRRGIDAEIVEISSDWSVQGVGIALQGPTLRALNTIGVIDRCLEVGFGINELVVGDVNCNVRDRIAMPRMMGDKYPAIMGIMRLAFQGILGDSARDAGAPMRLGVTVTSLNQDEDGIDVEFTDGTSGRYDLVVGADGIHSKIRGMVFDPTLKSHKTGQSVWRATIARPPEVDNMMMFYGPRNKAGFNPVNDEEMYIFLVQNTPNEIRVPTEKLAEVLRDELADYGGVMGASRDRIVDPDRILYRPIEVVFSPAPWYRGRVVLMGDAAHATTPHLASGAGMAIEDAIVLSEELATKSDVESGLKSYMERRYHRSRMIYENSIQLGEWEKNPSDKSADPVGLSRKSIEMLAQPL